MYPLILFCSFYFLAQIMCVFVYIYIVYIYAACLRCLDRVPWPSACLVTVLWPSACLGTGPPPSALPRHDASA